MRLLPLLFILFSLAVFSDEIHYYSIYRGDEKVAVSEITSSGEKIFERVLWLDGFSKEYTESSISLSSSEYSSKTYYENDKLPIIITLQNNKFEKRFPDKLITTYPEKDVEFVHRNSNLLLFLCFALKREGKFVCYDSDRMEKMAAELRKGEILLNKESAGRYYFNNASLDSASIFGLRIVREAVKIKIRNPYTINLSKIYTEDDFIVKKRHTMFSFGCFKGETAFDTPSGTLIVLLPFSFSSDMNGNSGTSIRPFTSLQLAENLRSPVLSLQLNLKPEERKILPQRIAELERELLKNCDRVLFIAFNDMCIDLAKSNVSSAKILINPALPDIEAWSGVIFSKYSAKGGYLFKSKDKFMDYEGLSALRNEGNLIPLYSGLKSASFVFSSSVLSEGEASAAKKIKGRVYYIKNIDRRLNSYNIYDLWSYEKNIFIDRKILDFINGLITK